ncbi:MAG: 7-carboxy-7-deazaguanine synthase QueE [Deltaproteobacteria bacterium]|nr:7-carboxy-7-deazaguanine synthase QueE [Deltaproteobacteria bacterium]
MVTAPLIEIFSSLQGEGPHVGEPMTFVRFQDCELSCKFCDTPLSFVKNKNFRIEWPPFSKKFEREPNPVTVDRLNEILKRYTDPTISITGGEPLQKSPFLKVWLPTLKKMRPIQILLETAGVHWEALDEIIPMIDIVSMDFKLPSSTGMRGYWKEHEQFLKIASQKEVYVKIVITAETDEAEVEESVRLLKNFPKVACILQPASAFGRFKAIPTSEQIHNFQKIVPQARVIPQLHKQLGIL